MSSHNVLLAVLFIACAWSAHASAYGPVGPSSHPAPVSASQLAKVNDLATAMKARWETLDASCDNRAVFARTYLYFTESVAQYIANLYFDDGNSMADFVMNLASKYTDAFDKWNEAKVAEVSSAWAEAFSWTVYGDSDATEDLLLGLNAHMTYDLAIATFESKYYKPGKKADFERLNDQIHAVLYNVSIDLRERYDSLFAPSSEAFIEDNVLPKIVTWREHARQSAVMLSIAQTPQQLEVFAKGIENAAAISAYTFQLAKAPTSEARIAFCKENRPDVKAAKLAEAFNTAAETLNTAAEALNTAPEAFNVAQQPVPVQETKVEQVYQEIPAANAEMEVKLDMPDVNPHELPPVQLTGGSIRLPFL